MPLPLGEVAERSECLKGRSTRENILPLPLGEVAERGECLKGEVPGKTSCLSLWERWSSVASA